MREIKFRAWVPVEKTICEVLIIDYKERTVQLPIQTAVTAPYWWDETVWDFEKVVLMQYTGLKDKNGVEIYEGDVVNVNKPWIKPRIEVVNFYTVGGMAGVHPFTDTEHQWTSYTAEVIGNIYEHPQLLETSE